MTMQAFYTKIQQAETAQAHALLAIAHASLRKVFSVRSEMDWGSWSESPATR